MNLAIICSWLNQYGGAERVLEVLHDLYPQAPIYTSVYDPDALPDEYKTWDIRTSFLDRIPMARNHGKMLLPLYPAGFERLDLRAYDLVLSLSSAFAHGVITSPETRHVCYCLTPARFLWNYDTYIQREGVGRLARLLLPLVTKRLRRWDRAAADRVDTFVAISRTVQQRISDYYDREAEIIYPPVRVPAVRPSADVDDYYLVVSRLVPYKRIDLAVRAFSALGLPLRIVGQGRDMAALQSMAGPTVEFCGYLPDDEVQRMMASCRALVFPGEEDFGLTPLEAMGLGRPVIAYAAGGALDTVIEGTTGVFFRDPTPESLAEAVSRLDTLDDDPDALVTHARQFDEDHFRARITSLVDEIAGG